MGRRTHKTPTSEDSFLWRICHALDIHPSELAEEIGVNYKQDLRPLLKGPRSRLPEQDVDPVWWKIKGYVSKRLGDLMAINYEMDKALQDDRKDRAMRIERFKRVVRKE